MTRRVSSSELARVLSASAMPIYVLDERRRVVFCNTACAEWVGLTAGELIGTTCAYHAGDGESAPSDAAALLCPPPDALVGKRSCGQVACRRSDGSLAHRRAEFLPLGTDAVDCPGLLVVVEPADVADDTVPADSPWPSQVEPTAAELHSRLIELRAAASRHYAFDHLIGQSAAMQRVRAQVALAAKGDANVSIVGPRGSGREHVARTIHFGSAGTPCAALESASSLVPVPAALMDAELMQAAVKEVTLFTPPTEGGPSGRMLLLDADDLPLDAQNELAGFLSLPGFHLQVLATARRPLVEFVESGAYLRELATTLSTLVVELPPLVERIDDVPLLVQHCVEQFNAQGARQLSGASPEALDLLAAYDWPGNVDDLEEVVREACRAADGPFVVAADLPKRLRQAASAAAHPRTEEETIVLDELLAQIEADLVRRAMRRAKGNKTKAAQLLGVTRPRLHRRLTELEEQGGGT